MKTMMKKSVLPISILCFILFSSFTFNNWELLGTKSVNYKIDKDIINVTGQEGRFTKLKLVVTGAPLNMHKMEVVYGNGDRDNIPLKNQFTRKSTSRIIDLEGNKRVIKKIIFFYDTKNNSRRKAKVSVFGRH